MLCLYMKLIYTNIETEILSDQWTDVQTIISLLAIFFFKTHVGDYLKKKWPVIHFHPGHLQPKTSN